MKSFIKCEGTKLSIGDKVHFSVSPFTHNTRNEMTQEQFYDALHGTHIVTGLKKNLMKTDKWNKWTNKFYFYKGEKDY